MTIEFFWMPGGPFALRCIMTLAAKNLEFQSRQLDPSKHENRTPEFLALSPKGTLPVLKDKTTIVRESQAIMFYLDRAYPQVPLYGSTPAEAGKVMQELCEQQSYAEPVLTPLIASFFFKRSATLEDLTALIDRFEVLLSDLNERLAFTGWLGGERLSAADISLYPLIRSVVDGMGTERARELGLKNIGLGVFPALSSWSGRLQSLTTAE